MSERLLGGSSGNVAEGECAFCSSFKLFLLVNVGCGGAGGGLCDNMFLKRGRQGWGRVSRGVQPKTMFYMLVLNSVSKLTLSCSLKFAL